MSSSALRVLSALGLLLLGGCGGEGGQGAPDEPTWFGGVQSLIASRCASCHGATPYADSIKSFRLDRYVKNDAASFDAYDYRDSIVEHAVDRLEPAMPLGGELSEVEKETLRRWLEQGAPKGTRDNATPTAERIAPTAATVTADQSLSLSFTSSDADGDGLVIGVGYRQLDGSNEVMLFDNLAPGQVELEIDTGQVVSLGHLEVFARVDDGYFDDPSENVYDIVLVEDLLVDHGARGTAPTVAVISPNGGDTVIGPTDITWAASDPDPGDTLSIDIELLQLDASGQVVAATELATGLPNSPASFAWDPADVATEDASGPIPYKIRVSARDAGALNTRSDSSDASFSVAALGGSTDLTWDEVKPIFVTYCGKCHSQPARTAALDYFRLDKYNAADPEAPTNADVGVFEERSLVYQRLVVAGSMPPAAESQPSQSDIDAIAEWILAGAPFGGGGGDALPSFAWITPNNSATTTVTSANVTLAWTASDPEAQPLTGHILMAALPNGIPPLNAATATCDGAEAGYGQVVASANIEDGSAVVTLPNTGFFCFKGELTDAASQTVIVTATRPVKF